MCKYKMKKKNDCRQASVAIAKALFVNSSGKSEIAAGDCQAKNCNSDVEHGWPRHNRQGRAIFAQNNDRQEYDTASNAKVRASLHFCLDIAIIYVTFIWPLEQRLCDD